MNKKIILGIVLMLTLVMTASADICIDKTAPTVPGNFVITDSPYDSDGNIVLTWTAATDEPECGGIDHYNIYRSTDNVNFVKINETTLLTFTEDGLTQGVTYFYQVTAVDKVLFNPHEGPAASASTTIGTKPSGGGGGGGGRRGGGGGGSVYIPPECTVNEDCEEGFVCVEETCEEEPEVTVAETTPTEQTGTKPTPKEPEKEPEEIPEEGLGGVTGQVFGFIGGTGNMLILLLVVLLLFLFFWKRRKKKDKPEFEVH